MSVFKKPEPEVPKELDREAQMALRDAVMIEIGTSRSLLVVSSVMAWAAVLAMVFGGNIFLMFASIVLFGSSVALSVQGQGVVAGKVAKQGYAVAWQAYRPEWGMQKLTCALGFTLFLLGLLAIY